MYYPAELVLRNYIPDSIEPGMFFIVRDPTGQPVQPLQLWQNALAGIDSHPVELYVIDPTDHSILATPDKIGWFDLGEESDEYRDIELKDINAILVNEGLIEIEINEIDNFYGAINPIIEEGKVIIRIL